LWSDTPADITRDLADRWTIEAGSWQAGVTDGSGLQALAENSIVIAHQKCDKDEYTQWAFRVRGIWEDYSFETSHSARIIFNWEDSDNYDFLEVRQDTSEADFDFRFFARVNGTETETSRRETLTVGWIEPPVHGAFDVQLFSRYEAGRTLLYGEYSQTNLPTAYGAKYGPDYVQASKVFGLGTGPDSTAFFRDVTISHWPDSRVPAIADCVGGHYCEVGVCFTEPPPEFSVSISGCVDEGAPTEPPWYDYIDGYEQLNGTYLLRRATWDENTDPICGWRYDFPTPLSFIWYSWGLNPETQVYEYRVYQTFTVTGLYLLFADGLRLRTLGTYSLHFQDLLVAQHVPDDCGAISGRDLTGLYYAGEVIGPGTADVTAHWPEE